MFREEHALIYLQEGIMDKQNDQKKEWWQSRGALGSFFNSLFDFSFTDFITSKIVKLLYGLSIVASGLIALFLIIVGFNISTGFGVVMLLIVAPLVFILSVIYARVLLEIIIVIFRIAENAAEIAQQGRKTPQMGEGTDKKS
jgi:hypothetical protein